MALPTLAVRHSMDVGAGPESGSVFIPRMGGMRRPPVAPGIGTGSPVSPIVRPISTGLATQQSPAPTPAQQRGPMLPSRRTL